MVDMNFCYNVSLTPSHVRFGYDECLIYTPFGHADSSVT